MSIAVGTSGWSYDHWKGEFYPDDLPGSEHFDFYATHFPTVEVNYSFYRLPAEKTVTKWHDAAPDRFRFAVKGSRYITHVLRLSDASEAVGTFMDRMAGLKSYLGVVLWQLPPNFKRDLDVLEGFLGQLPRSTRHAVEFRHDSWLAEDTYELLERHNTALVCVSSERMPDVRRATADFVYARFHGLETGYDYDYISDDLEPWASFLREQHSHGRDGYVYFNNDAHGNAPRDAAQIIELLGDTALEWG